MGKLYTVHFIVERDGEVIWESPSWTEFLEWEPHPSQKMTWGREFKEKEYMCFYKSSYSRYKNPKNININVTSSMEPLSFAIKNIEGRGTEIKRISVPKEIEETDMEILLWKLRNSSAEEIRHIFPEAVYVVTRSYDPRCYHNISEKKIPWKQVARRSYLWLVSLEERNENRGRRIEWDGDTILFRTKKDALKYMYGTK